MKRTTTDLDTGPGLIDDHVGVGEDEAVALHDEPRPVAHSDWLARVVVPHAAVLEERSSSNSMEEGDVKLK